MFYNYPAPIYYNVTFTSNII